MQPLWILQNATPMGYQEKGSVVRCEWTAWSYVVAMAEMRSRLQIHCGSVYRIYDMLNRLNRPGIRRAWYRKHACSSQETRLVDFH